MFSFRWVLAEHTKDHADGSPAGGPTNPHHATGLYLIDCPSLTNRHKNAADIRIALDVVDALNAATRYDEFVIASSDADFTPLLQRLRAADRRSTVMSTQGIAIAYEAMADQHLDEQDVFDLLQPESIESEAVLTELRVSMDERATVAHPEGARGAATGGPEMDRFRELVVGAYENATDPINLARLSAQVRGALGDVVERTNWFGASSFSRAVSSLELENLMFSQHHMWDSSRHAPPAVASLGRPVDGSIVLPEAVGRCCTVADLPRLDQGTWEKVFDTLAMYAATHTFNLTESTKWSRDTLAGDGVDVGRAALGYVVRGSSYGGAPLNSDPPPDAQQIAHAFLSNVLGRARMAGLALGAADVEQVASWLRIVDFVDVGDDDVMESATAIVSGTDAPPDDVPVSGDQRTVRS
ncbi:MAG: NYN domain-containing protein [Acidimicrobiia bacterium]